MFWEILSRRRPGLNVGLPFHGRPPPPVGGRRGLGLGSARSARYPDDHGCIFVAIVISALLLLLGATGLILVHRAEILHHALKADSAKHSLPGHRNEAYSSR